MVDEPVHFGLIPVGNVTLKSKESKKIWPDYCGSSENIS